MCRAHAAPLHRGDDARERQEFQGRLLYHLSLNCRSCRHQTFRSIWTTWGNAPGEVDAPRITPLEGIH
ncbi:MAG: hypothetical protein WKF96_23775, partial [Solirubrobacteraceae bacterium]